MLISVNNLTKYNGIKCIVDDVSFAIEEKDKIALIGTNGTGKSTLLHILAGIEDYQGTIIKKKDLRISFLPQNPSFNKELTIFEQISAFLKEDLKDYEVKTMLNKFGLYDHSMRIKELSGGQLRRIALSIALLTPCDLLILDEPTNHLDHEMIEYLEKFLTKFNKALLMVTHDRYFLERISHKIIELDHHKLYEYVANYSTFLTLKQQREETALSQQRKRKLFLKKELEWVRAGVQARTTKSKDRLERFEKLSKIADISTTQNVEMIQVASRLGKKTIELTDVSHTYKETLFEPFSYHFKRYDRIGICGSNGCGKTTLLNIIAKTLTPTTGYVEHGDTIKIGYFKQGHDDMNPNMRVIDYIKETAHILSTSEGQLTAKQMCERFLFDSSMQYTLINKLSGGEKRRLYLLKILMEGPNVLILDEPTNDLDIATLQILEDYLDHFSGIIITVSHDRYFIDRVCDHLFVIKDKHIHYINGGYSTYLSMLENNKKQAQEPKVKYEKKRKIKLTYREEKELEHLLEHLPVLEKQLQEIDQLMDQTSDYPSISKLTTQREEICSQIEDGEMRLMELLEKQEALT